MASVLDLSCTAFDGVALIQAILIIAICAILNRLGGSKNKNFRRLGIGIALAAYGLLNGVVWYYALLCILTSQLFRLPITLRGDSIPRYWYNWLWLPVVGFAYGMVPAPLSAPNLKFAFLSSAAFSFFFSLTVALSNIRATARYFKWQYVEYFYGACVGIIAAIFVRIRKKRS